MLALLKLRKEPESGRSWPLIRNLCGIWGFPKIRGTILGVPIIRTIVFWGSTLGSPLFWETTIWVLV